MVNIKINLKVEQSVYL